MKTLHDYGPLLLASRLRKVSESFYTGVDQVYREMGVKLSSRCFPILFLLRDRGRLGISELAESLGQSHPAVSQMSRKLLANKVVREWPDPEDSRRRLLGISPKGVTLMQRLAPVWSAIAAAVEKLEAEFPLSDSLAGIDVELTQQAFSTRIRSLLYGTVAASVEIIKFESRYARDFKRLNLAWLRKYFRVEPIDEAVLSRPGKLLRQGGHILMARSGDAIVGTCALLPDAEHRFELSKMAVAEACQGLGVGRRLLEAAIKTFKERCRGELYLETSSKLKPAIHLYESAGFIHARRPDVPVHYARSDVYMVYRG